ncbi:MAG: hypothetical protein J6U00_11780 [Ruminococcus sp.]|nr:hypothetical protein [Ruminococcus sp.]
MRIRRINHSAIIDCKLRRIIPGISTNLNPVVKIHPAHTQNDHRDRNALPIDELFSTGSTLRKVAAAIKKAGAASIHCTCCYKTISHKVNLALVGDIFNLCF